MNSTKIKIWATRNKCLEVGIDKPYNEIDSLDVIKALEDKKITSGTFVCWHPVLESSISTGANLIMTKRERHITKHKRTQQYDLQWDKGQLVKAARVLSWEKVLDRESYMQLVPEGWDTALWMKMCNKPTLDRIVIAGSFLAAEADRLLNMGHQLGKDIKDVVDGPTLFDQDKKKK